MLIKNVSDSEAFLALDNTTIREILHKKNDEIALNISVAYATLNIGETSLPHKLKTSREIYFILKGQGKMTINNETKIVTSGDAIFIPAGATQFINNIGSEMLEFVCIVDPSWTDKDEELVK